MRPKVAIIGGGIAGATAALYLSRFDLSIELFEKENSLLNGPPMCHLHAGGNLYREIDDSQCLQLLKESLDLLKLYPYAIDFRPTLLATPKEDPYDPLELLPRLQFLQQEYAKLIEMDRDNARLGDPKEYFSLYSYKDALDLQAKQTPHNPKNTQEWIIPALKLLDLQKLKFPLIAVNEYGLNLFRIAANVTLLLQQQKNVTIHYNQPVSAITQRANGYTIAQRDFDYLINAAGFRSGHIDDMLGIKRQRLVEFKAAYVTQWKSAPASHYPEIIFFGQRGTPQGMAQFTPYPDGYFQLHGMTEEITLFKNGLAASSKESSQPKLQDKFLTKIEKGWPQDLVIERSRRAIDHIARFIPEFKTAQPTPKPLFGAQQIPGKDAALRASEVSFDAKNYARCEIVKASSILSMADAIAYDLTQNGLLDPDAYKKRRSSVEKNSISNEKITEVAKKLCKMRGYPESLGSVVNGVRERI